MYCKYCGFPCWDWICETCWKEGKYIDKIRKMEELTKRQMTEYKIKLELIKDGKAIDTSEIEIDINSEKYLNFYNALKELKDNQETKR